MEGFQQYAPQTPPLNSDEEELSPRPLHRSYAMKQPMVYEDEEEEPDLAGYFAQFALEDPSVIAICRTYANYLAAKQPKKARGPYQKRAREEKEEENS